MSSGAARKAGIATLAACLVAAVAAPSAGAQCRNVFQPDLSGETGGSLVLICTPDPTPVKPRTRARSKKKAKKKVVRPTRAQYRALRFRSRASVTRKVQADLVKRLATGRPEAALITSQIEAGSLLAQSRKDLRQKRWATNDLGDAYAQALIYMWLVVDNDTRTSTATDRAVRKDLRAQLALDRKTRRASDAKQQEYAERLGSWTTVIAGSYSALLRDPDATAADIRRLRAEARKLARSAYLLGVDLAKIDLTRSGVEAR